MRLNAISTRRSFVASLAAGACAPALGLSEEPKCDLAIVGGSLGGCAAALAALRNGLRVVMTEESDWIGGQLTSQAVPPDEHRWIETTGANRSYRELRSRIRKYYRENYPLNAEAASDPAFNPGNGNVSRLCAEPRVSLNVLESWLGPYVATGKLVILRRHVAVDAETDRDRVRAVTIRSLETGESRVLQGDYFVDATELGELLPLTGTEYVTGSESQAETGELHASDTTRPENQQAFTMCFAVQYRAGENHVINKPQDYAFWQKFVPQLSPPWPGRLLDFTYTHPPTGRPKTLGFDPAGPGTVGGALNLWTYRRIIDQSLFAPGHFAGDISLINWPQNDYLLGNLVDVSPEEAQRHVNQAKQLSLSLLYWLQTEAPRPDGDVGFPGLRLRPDLMGTEDGLAMRPYIRESRRIRAVFTVLEQHVGRENRSLITRQPASEVEAAEFPDSVGIGSYPIDLHPTSGGDNYIDFPSLRFQIPLGCLLPVRIDNLLPACKNIGTTHVTNGCYRLHPVEWGVGEAVGCLLSFIRGRGILPRSVGADPKVLAEFQQFLQTQGVELAWS